MGMNSLEMSASPFGDVAIPKEIDSKFILMDAGEPTSSFVTGKPKDPPEQVAGTMIGNASSGVDVGALAEGAGGIGNAASAIAAAATEAATAKAAAVVAEYAAKFAALPASIPGRIAGYERG